MALTAVTITKNQGMTNASIGVYAFATGASETYATGGFDLTLTGTGITASDIQVCMASAVESGTGIPDPSLSFAWNASTSKLVAYKVIGSSTPHDLVIAEVSTDADIQSKTIACIVVTKSTF